MSPQAAKEAKDKLTALLQANNWSDFKEALTISGFKLWLDSFQEK